MATNMYYPAQFILDKKTNVYVVTFRDIPEALTQGYGFEEAHEMAQDALITSLDFYFEDNRSIPMPSKIQENDKVISLPVSIWAKVLLLNTMLDQNISQSELARRLGKSRQEIQRLINLKHITKIDTISDALVTLNKQVKFSIEDF